MHPETWKPLWEAWQSLCLHFLSILLPLSSCSPWSSGLLSCFFFDSSHPHPPILQCTVASPSTSSHTVSQDKFNPPWAPSHFDVTQHGSVERGRKLSCEVLQCCTILLFLPLCLIITVTHLSVCSPSPCISFSPLMYSNYCSHAYFSSFLFTSQSFFTSLLLSSLHCP